MGKTRGKKRICQILYIQLTFPFLISPRSDGSQQLLLQRQHQREPLSAPDPSNLISDEDQVGGCRSDTSEPIQPPTSGGRRNDGGRQTASQEIVRLQRLARRGHGRQLQRHVWQRSLSSSRIPPPSLLPLPILAALRFFQCAASVRRRRRRRFPSAAAASPILTNE